MKPAFAGFILELVQVVVVAPVISAIVAYAIRISQTNNISAFVSHDFIFLFHFNFPSIFGSGGVVVAFAIGVAVAQEVSAFVVGVIIAGTIFVAVAQEVSAFVVRAVS